MPSPPGHECLPSDAAGDEPDASESRAVQAERRLEESGRELERISVALRSAARRFEELFQGLPVACFTYDRDGIIFEVNRECERLTGFDAHEVQGRSMYETIKQGVDEDQSRAIIRDVFERGESLYGLELEQWTKDGGSLHVLCSTFPFRGLDGSILGAICTLVDITERKAMERQIAEQVQRLNGYAHDLEAKKEELEHANQRLAMLAATDGLTGVANRRVFRERLDHEIGVAKKSNSMLSVVLLDVDYFKRFNDTFGHQAGDEALKRVAEALSGQIRMDDLAARFGGEEFVLLLPGAPAEAAMSVAERVRSAIERRETGKRKVTASFGVATVTGKDADARVILDQADAALYASKGAGRNCVTHWRSLPTSSSTSSEAA